MLPKAPFLALAAVFFALPVSAIEQCGQGRPASCVLDGDTVRLRGETFQFYGYDVPQTKGVLCGGTKEAALGRMAAKRLVELLNGGGLFMHRVGVDREGRTLAKLYVDGANVAGILIAEGLARRLPNGQKFWCR